MSTCASGERREERSRLKDSCVYDSGLGKSRESKAFAGSCRMWGGGGVGEGWPSSCWGTVTSCHPSPVAASDAAREEDARQVI